jgi:carboxymethylenebutenolidase
MSKTVQLKASDGFTLDAYVAEPAGTPKALVVVIQEVFGVNVHIRAVADGYAKHGYLAIAPAMFDRVQKHFESGYTQPEIAKGVELMKASSWDNAMLDVDAAKSYGGLKGKAGIVGYCYGGAVTWLAACRLDGFGAASSYYGGAIPNFMNENPKCPIMLHFGEHDHSLPIEKAKEIAAKHPEAEAHYYDAQHGFNCDMRGSYDAGAAATALERTLDFFGKHLG